MPFMLSRFVNSGLLHRALCGTVAVASIAHVAPCMARQPAQRDPAKVAGATSKHRKAEHSGPADIVALPAAPTVQAATWRLCTDCAYDDGIAKAQGPLGIRANFQPIGGTVSYRF